MCVVCCVCEHIEREREHHETFDTKTHYNFSQIFSTSIIAHTTVVQCVYILWYM